MDIGELTLNQCKQIQELGTGGESAGTIKTMLGKKCIIRTYSAGVWFGEVVEKEGAEVIIRNARRLFYWKAAESISLSAVAVKGINQSESKVCVAVDSVWLEAIELIPCEALAINSIGDAPDVEAE